MSELPRSILIVGTGSLASLFAARLARVGLRVTMLGTWQAGLESLQENGVRLVEAGGWERRYPVKAIANPAECQPARYALVLVKSWQTARAAAQLADCLAPDGLALTLQNGLGNHEILAAALGAGRVASGTTTTGATLLGPGLVRPGGEGAISLEADPRLVPLGGLLQRAGFSVATVPDLEALVWGKLAINAAINPLTALLGVPNGELLARPPARNLMGKAAREVAAVAAARGIHLPYPDPAAAAEEVASRTATNRSSMLQDVRRNAPTEIDAICGAVVQAGAAAGVPTPVNGVLWQLVKALQVPENGRETGLPFPLSRSVEAEGLEGHAKGQGHSPGKAAISKTVRNRV